MSRFVLCLCAVALCVVLASDAQAGRFRNRGGCSTGGGCNVSGSNGCNISGSAPTEASAADLARQLINDSASAPAKTKAPEKQPEATKTEIVMLDRSSAIDFATRAAMRGRMSNLASR